MFVMYFYRVSLQVGTVQRNILDIALFNRQLRTYLKSYFQSVFHYLQVQ